MLKKNPTVCHLLLLLGFIANRLGTPMNRGSLRQSGAILATSLLGLATSLIGESPKRLVDTDIAAALDKARLSMLFQGKTAEECKRWQKKFKARVDFGTGL